MKNPNAGILSLLFITSMLILNTGCSFKSVTRTKDISYMEAEPSKGLPKQELNVFAPRKEESLKEVFVFIHGGSWNSGNKDQYNFMGARFARKGVVAVNIDYPLSPKADYHDMALASANAIKWVKENIEDFGGDPNRIFVSGHSAGGHLAALISVENTYFDNLGIANPIKGVILNDAAGLDMYGFLKATIPGEGEIYLPTFTEDTTQWKAASPIYHLTPKLPNMMILTGSKTYPSILNGGRAFTAALKEKNQQPIYHELKGKKHVPMITQFIWSWNPLYGDIIGFMEGK